MCKLSGINVRKKEEGELVCGYGYIWGNFKLNDYEKYFNDFF